MTKKRILDVATEEFATLGYSGLSMNKLAEKLKINKAMIYYYFKEPLANSTKQPSQYLLSSIF